MLRKVFFKLKRQNLWNVLSKSLLTTLFYRQIIAKKKNGTAKYSNADGVFTESHFLVRTSLKDISLAPGNIAIAELQHCIIVYILPAIPEQEKADNVGEKK